MAKENLSPNVQSFEQIVSSLPITNASGMLVALPVICNRGPIEPTIVDNTGFVKLFMDSEIKRSTDISQVFAYELSKHCNILVCRAVSTTNVAVMNSAGDSSGMTADIESKQVTFRSGDTSPFAVIANYPTDQNYCKVSWSEYNPGVKYGVIKIEDLNDPQQSVSFEFSLDIDEVDGYGLSKFITEVNSRQSLVTVVVNSTLAANQVNVAVSAFSGRAFGSVSGYTQVTLGNLSSVVHVSTALNKILDRDSDRITMITDAGLANPSIAGTIAGLADKVKALGVITHPSTLTTFASFRSYVGNLTNSALKTSHNYACTPWYKDYSITDFPILLPETLSYIKRVISNKKSNQEFAPVFGIKYGVADGTEQSLSIRYNYNPAENPPSDNNTANEVQLMGWNPVVYRRSRGFSFFVNNWTLQGKKDAMSEENNRRMWNQIQYDLNSTMENFLAEPNNEVTRENMGDAIDTYFKTIVLNWGYTISNYRKRIEPYNPSLPNTVDVYVDIQFTGSVKWIRVFYKSVPVIAQ